MPAYPRVLKLGSTRQGAILLDIGCCFGNDVRRAVADGYPIQNVIASDLRQDFWELGHALFRSTPETFPVAFVAGDAFDNTFIAAREPFLELPTQDVPPLGSVTSLTPLQGHISAIHASAFFHLFNEDRQTELARKVGSLLSPLPGSIIFGAHRGLPIPGEVSNNRKEIIFAHSPESWEKLWNGVIFPKGSVLVEASLRERQRGDGLSYELCWSVTRL